jgi:hypothetical protein
VATNPDAVGYIIKKLGLQCNVYTAFGGFFGNKILRPTLTPEYLTTATLFLQNYECP